MRAFAVGLTFVLLGCTSVEFATGGAGGATGTGGSGSGASGGSGAGGSGGALTCEPVPDLDSDPNHCGACDHACGDGTCANGACQPVELAISSDAEGRGLTVTDELVVWLIDADAQASRGLWSLPLLAPVGEKPTQIREEVGERIAYAEPTLFWTGAGILSFDLDAELFHGTSGPTTNSCVDYLAIDAMGRLYCRVESFGQETVRRFNDPSQSTGYDPFWGPDLYENVRGMVVVGDDLYFGRGAGLTRWSLEEDTGETYGDESVRGDVVADASHVFYGESAEGGERLMRYAIGAPDTTVFAPGLDSFHLHLDARSVYLAGQDTSALRRLDRTSGEVETLWTTESTIRGLTGTESHLFFTTEDGRLFRITK